MTQREKLYAKRDAMALDEAGNYYINHVMAMGSEQLHSKSAIASELAHRDMLIDKLTKELQAAKAQPQWIPVSERLPTYGDNVLIVADGEIETENQVFEFKKGKFSSSDFFESNKDDGIYYYIREITHWMPLPAPPTNQEVE